MVWSGDFDADDIKAVVYSIFPRGGFTLTAAQIQKLKKRYLSNIRAQVEAYNKSLPPHLRKTQEELDRSIKQAGDDFENALDLFKQK